MLPVPAVLDSEIWLSAVKTGHRPHVESGADATSRARYFLAVFRAFLTGAPAAAAITCDPACFLARYASNPAGS